MLKHPVISTLLAALFLVGTATAQVAVEYDETVDFSGFDSYALKEGTPARRVEVQIRIEGFIKRELEALGLREVADTPDLFVATYALVDKLTLEQLADPTTWQFYTGMTDMDAYSVGAGTLVVDVIEADQGEVLWRGLVAAPVSGKVSSVERKIDKAVTKMFKRFPRAPSEP